MLALQRNDLAAKYRIGRIGQSPQVAGVSPGPQRGYFDFGEEAARRRTCIARRPRASPIASLGGASARDEKRTENANQQKNGPRFDSGQFSPQRPSVHFLEG